MQKNGYQENVESIIVNRDKRFTEGSYFGKFFLADVCFGIRLDDIDFVNILGNPSQVGWVRFFCKAKKRNPTF